MVAIRPRSWTVDDASEWLGRQLATEPPAPQIDAAARSRLLRVCAVLARFPAAGLCSKEGPIAEAELRDALRNDLAKLPRRAGEDEMFGLRPPARDEGLALLSSLSNMRAQRQLNPIAPPGVTQQVLDAYLEEDFRAAASDDVAELQAVLQVSGWLRRFLPGMPDAAAIERRLAGRRLLEPMERLTAGFMGRDEQLTRLRTFVGVLEAQSTIEAVARFLAKVAPARSILMLTGIGGVGKSTLLAKFILQHAKSAVPFPWVCLDFDNPRLNVATLSTIFQEAVTQLRAVYPDADWDELLGQASERSAIAEAAGYTSAAPDRTLTLSDVELNERLHLTSARALASQFAAHLRQAVARSRPDGLPAAAGELPFLLVLDTFEEVQKRGIEMATVLWSFLLALQSELPRLRIVVSGRAQVPEIEVLGSVEKLEVPEFDEAAAVSFLSAQGIAGADVARSLYKQVGGNPLSLKLAARVAKLEDAGDTGITGLKTTSFLVFAAAEHVVQGQLYRRILDRIADPELRLLAHPGLVVRRVTPEVIRDVLAEPCGLGMIDDGQASRLFDELRMQVDLVVNQPDGSLRHQQALRRVMLKLLETERPEQARQIHARAIRFYRDAHDLPSRTEWLYHALQLGVEDGQEIRSHWDSEAGESLLGSIDELPPASKLRVYELAGRQPPPELRALASLDQWERLAEDQARSALRYNDFRRVRGVLAERRERTAGSGLYAIAALLSIATGDTATALRQIDEGIASAQSVNRLDRLVELLRLRGEVLERLEHFAEADAAMAEAQNLALRIAAPVLALQILAGRARINRPSGSPFGTITSAEVDDVVRQTSDADFAAARIQLRGLFRRFGPLSLLLLRKGLRIFQLRSAPRIKEKVPWREELQDMAAQGRTNEFLQTLLDNEPDDTVNRAIVARILEDALDPRQGSRAR